MHCFFFSSRRRHTRYWRDWSSDVCSSDLFPELFLPIAVGKNYSGKKLLTSAPSGRGFQFSLFGLAAFTARSEERRVGKEYKSVLWRCNGEKNCECVEIKL